MNILFLAHRIPYPPDKGDKIRSFNLIKFLSTRHNVFLATTLDEESDADYTNLLKEFCSKVFAVYFPKQIKLVQNFFSRSPFSVANFYDARIQEFVDKTLREEKIEAIICYCSSMAEYVFQSSVLKDKESFSPKLIMDYVDLDSDKWRQYAQYTKFPKNLIYKTEHKRLLKYEIKINQRFDHSVFVSSREVEAFEKVYSHLRPTDVVSNGIDCDYFFPISLLSGKNIQDFGEDFQDTFWGFSQQPKLVFTGFMDYFANEDGVLWFCENIFPSVQKAIPDVQFYIVGNKPTNKIWSLSEIDGVTVTGYVHDIRPYYWMADVCVIPLRIARGLQNKVIESMATGNAVVATSNASDGILCHPGEDILIADDPTNFADAIIRLLGDKKQRMNMSIKAYGNVKANYTWEENLVRFEEILAS